MKQDTEALKNTIDSQRKEIEQLKTAVNKLQRQVSSNTTHVKRFSERIRLLDEGIRYVKNVLSRQRRS